MSCFLLVVNDQTDDLRLNCGVNRLWALASNTRIAPDSTAAPKPSRSTRNAAAAGSGSEYTPAPASPSDCAEWDEGGAGARADASSQPKL